MSKLIVAGLCIITTQANAVEPIDYGRAEQMLSWNTSKLIANNVVTPHWIGGQSAFWYRNNEMGGHLFKRFDIETSTTSALFDHAKLASALHSVTEESYDARNLPFDTLILEDELAITVTVKDRRYRCSIIDYACAEIESIQNKFSVLSPDGLREAYIENFNVFVRQVKSGETNQLTRDGNRYYRYGSLPYWVEHLFNKGIRKKNTLGELKWSPDSRQIAVLRYDERKVKHFHTLYYTSIRPELTSYPYAVPGDNEIPIPHIFVVEVETGEITEIDLPKRTAFAGPEWFGGITHRGDYESLVWRGDSEFLYLTVPTRGFKQLSLIESNAKTGSTRSIITEGSPTYVDPMPWHVGDDLIIWGSERDGWAHLYQYDRQGNLITQLTRGNWVVHKLVHVDEKAGQIFFTAFGREDETEPYFNSLYRLDLQSKDIKLLTPETAMHNVHLSPDGLFFVDTYSRVDLPPVTVLRNTEGRIMSALERADISPLREAGWRAPERFTVKGRDRKTLLQGVMYKPSNFDAKKKYPLIDHIYPGPQFNITPKSFAPSGTFGGEQALAELGFVVINLDNMGNPFRSKEFHDTWYGNFSDSGLPDHVTAIDQLAQRFEYIDRGRVGIYGFSGGGFASTKAMLTYPSIFHVAVSVAGNHDNRSNNYYWGEKYNGLIRRDAAKGEGWDSYLDQANYLLAKNLKGRILLVHGTRDENVHPGNTMRLVDALVRENKDFDMYLIPTLHHSTNLNPSAGRFLTRKIWDYFVTHLLDEVPPKEYSIRMPPVGSE